MSEGKFFPVEISTLKSASKDITFDVFLKLSEDNYAHVFSKSSGIDYKRLSHYINKGMTHLFVRGEDEIAFREFISRSPERILLDPNVSDSKKVSVLLNMAEQNVAELFNIIKVPEEAAHTSIKIIKNFIALLSENPRTLATLIKTASHGDYLFYHSISTAVISMFIAKASGQANARMLEVCGLGGFLHDIGVTALPSNIADSPVDLTAAQWREMRLHPKLGIKMLDGTSNVPDEVRYIVFQHHEEPGGAGYPSGLRGPVIFYPAKIVSLADSFCALVTKRPFREAYSIEQALGIIQHEVGKFDRELVLLLVQFFGARTRMAA